MAKKYNHYESFLLTLETLETEALRLSSGGGKIVSITECEGKLLLTTCTELKITDDYHVDAQGKRIKKQTSKSERKFLTGSKKKR